MISPWNTWLPLGLWWEEYWKYWAELIWNIASFFGRLTISVSCSYCWQILQIWLGSEDHRKLIITCGRFAVVSRRIWKNLPRKTVVPRNFSTGIHDYAASFRHCLSNDLLQASVTRVICLLFAHVRVDVTKCCNNFVAKICWFLMILLLSFMVWFKLPSWNNFSAVDNLHQLHLEITAFPEYQAEAVQHLHFANNAVGIGVLGSI